MAHESISPRSSGRSAQLAGQLKARRRALQSTVNAEDAATYGLEYEHRRRNGSLFKSSVQTTSTTVQRWDLDTESQVQCELECETP